MNERNLRVVVVDDHPIFLEGVRSLLDKDGQIDIVGQGMCGADVEPLVKEFMPDILLLDLQMKIKPSGSNFRALPTVRRLLRKYQTKVVILSGTIDNTILEGAFERGIRGYIVKDDVLSIDLGAVLHKIHRGELYCSTKVLNELIQQRSKVRYSDVLTPWQIKILQETANLMGQPRSIIAAKLNIAEGTYNNHLTEIGSILGMSGQGPIVFEALRRGLIDFKITTNDAD